jgi:RNA polymerase sigma-70 factor (ECF subfamily)
MTSAQQCCGRAAAEQCRCYTDAAAIADAIRAFVRRRVRHPQDAEDITQDALLRLYRAAHDLHDELALDAWMYRIARTAIIDHHRRAAARPQPVDIGRGMEEPAADEPEEPRAAESLATCLSVLLDRVPEHYRRALELTELGGLTQERAAVELGLSTSGMKSRVQRGRRLLREQVTRCCEVALDTHGALADVEPRRRDGRC